MASASVPPLSQDVNSEDNLQKDSEWFKVFFSKETTQTLLTQVHQTYNTGMNDLLLTALARALWRWIGEKKTLIFLEGHGREPIDERIDVTRTVGWLTSEYPVLLDISVSEDLGYQIKSIKETLRKVPNNGVGYGILKYVTDPEKRQRLSLNMTPQIVFNYLGTFDEDLNTSLLSLAEESVGTTVDPSSSRLFHLEINGLVVEEKLELTFSYNQKMYHQSTIKTLTRFYEEELSMIITHCLNTEPELTPNDITDEGFDIDTLDEILDNLSS